MFDLARDFGDAATYMVLKAVQLSLPLLAVGVFVDTLMKNIG